jgi:hypothetical protein
MRLGRAYDSVGGIAVLLKFLMMVIRQIEYDSYVHPTFFILILLNKKKSKTSTVEFNNNGSTYHGKLDMQNGRIFSERQVIQDRDARAYTSK